MLPCVCSETDHRRRQNVVEHKSSTRGVVCLTDVLQLSEVWKAQEQHTNRM